MEGVPSFYETYNLAQEPQIDALGAPGGESTWRPQSTLEALWLLKPIHFLHLGANHTIVGATLTPAGPVSETIWGC